MDQPVKQQFKFGAIYVKYEDSVTSLVYDGETLDVKGKKKLDTAGWSPDKLNSFPQFVAREDTDSMMRHGNYCTISTQLQVHEAESFEEMRELFYSTFRLYDSPPDEIGSSPDQKLKHVGSPSPNLNFLSMNKLFGEVIRLQEVKKRCLSYVAMNLRETILQQSKRMDKLCNMQRLQESVLSSAKCEIDGRDKKSLFKDGCELSKDSKSSNPGDSAEGSFGIDRGLDTCLRCSLQRNVFLMLEKLQECLTTALMICERMDNVFNDVRDLTSLNCSIGKRLLKVLLSELKCVLLLSFQVLKMQSLHVRNLNKMQTLLLELRDPSSLNDLHTNEKTSKSAQSAQIGLKSPLKSVVESRKPADEEQQVSEEERGNTSSTSCSLESLEKPSTQVCQLFSNFHHLKLRNSELHRFLQVFIKCAKILKPLEMSVIHVLRDFFEEEENSVPKSLENIIQTAEEIFPRESVLLKHHRNPYEQVVHMAKTSDRLRASYAGKSGSIIVPNGKGTLCAVDGRVIYQGEWKKGKRHGCGKAFMTCEKHAYWSAIGEYEGNWRNNCRHGFGHMVFSDGSVYDGEWEMDEIQGRGVMNRFDGCVLEGFWLGGNPNGCMTFTWPHGLVEYREYRRGDIVRVFDPRYDLSTAIQTVRCINRVSEEKTFYKNYVRSLQKEVSSLTERYDKKEKRSLAEERAEKMQIVNTLQRELDQCQKTQREEAQKLEELRRRSECQICMQHPKDCLLLPCLHFNFCTSCVERLKAREPSLKCPTCRQLTNGEIRCKFS